MKHFILIIAALFSAIICSAQVPQGFSFQSLVLDDNSAPIRDQVIGVQIQILDESASGTILYSESHRPMTNSNGLYTIEIGNGDRISGGFENIDWLSGSKYVALSHDVSGGSDYRLVGSSQLLSVPYALASGTSFVAPKIYASTVRISPREIDVSQPDRTELFSYQYEWIQGEPEDVYVEYSNLPDNINIQNRNGNDFIVNASSVDTIIDGIIRPTSYFGVIDPSANLTPGSYLIDMTFRTSTEVLAEIKYPLDIIDPIVEEVDCTEDFVGERILVSACDSLSNFLGSSIEVERVDNKSIIVSNFLGITPEVELEFIDQECNRMTSNLSGLIIGNFNLNVAEVMGDNGILEFMLEFEDQMGENFSCILTYE